MNLIKVRRFVTAIHGRAPYFTVSTIMVERLIIDQVTKYRVPLLVYC
jgi:hypothetical protein